jgi:hypothetical protein
MKTQRDRHRGGQEPPANVQDRPEQNAGYDAAVRNERGSKLETASEAEVDSVVDDAARAKGVRIKQR